MRTLVKIENDQAEVKPGTLLRIPKSLNLDESLTLSLVRAWVITQLGDFGEHFRIELKDGTPEPCRDDLLDKITSHTRKIPVQMQWELLRGSPDQGNAENAEGAK